MERLTWRDTVGQALLAPKYNDKYDALELIDILLDRLVAYEDTGLTPEECATIAKSYPKLFDMVEELQRYRNAEAEGLLLVLPCKVGDTVYITKGSVIYSEKVRTFFLGHPSHRIEQRNMRMMRLETYDIPFEQLGKTAFLTREAAEAALKERDV